MVAPVEAKLHKVSKKYRFEWILKNISTNFIAGNQYAILGPNGSGKSTFLKIVSGHLSPSKGKIEFLSNNQPIEVDNVYKEVSIAAPYVELIEEFTLQEALSFHKNFKPFVNNATVAEMIALMELEKSKDKEIKYFSSGMKQRVKLLLAICSQSRLLLLDEPTTNLDQKGIDWYLNLIQANLKDRITIVASNAAVDYGFCKERLDIMDYK